MAGNPPLVGATLYNDSAGAIESVVATLAPAATVDAVTALAGMAGLRCVAGPAVIGGAFAGVHTLSLFGPGGWTFEPQSSGASPSGIASGAWEQDTSKTYSAGPVASFGAARVDLPPAGTVDCGWRLYPGSSPVGALGAIPISAAGDVLQVSGWVKSSGLAANAALRLEVEEFDSSGSAAALHDGRHAERESGGMDAAEWKRHDRGELRLRRSAAARGRYGGGGRERGRDSLV